MMVSICCFRFEGQFNQISRKKETKNVIPIRIPQGILPKNDYLYEDA